MHLTSEEIQIPKECHFFGPTCGLHIVVASSKETACIVISIFYAAPIHARYN